MILMFQRGLDKLKCMTITKHLINMPYIQTLEFQGNTLFCIFKLALTNSSSCFLKVFCPFSPIFSPVLACDLLSVLTKKNSTHCSQLRKEIILNHIFVLSSLSQNMTNIIFSISVAEIMKNALY